MAESLHILLGTSACLQWLCHSGERTVARGSLVHVSSQHDSFHVDGSCNCTYLLSYSDTYCDVPGIIFVSSQHGFSDVDGLCNCTYLLGVLWYLL